MRNRVFFLAVGVTCCCFLLFISIISIPDNPVNLRYSSFNNLKLNAMFPEGWAFFTRDPQEEQFFLYEWFGGKLREVPIKNAGPSQLFGIIRRNRAIQSKILRVSNSIDEKYWFHYRGDIKGVPVDSLTIFSVDIAQPAVCGKYLVQARKPLPWPWYASSRSDKIYLPSRVICINFKCRDDK